MTEKQENEMADKTEAVNNVAKWPALTFDVELFQHNLDKSDLTQEQKDEFLLDLWNCMVCLVDLGFGVHPLQQAASDGCGQIQNFVDFFRLDPEDMVECDNNPKSDFNRTADAQSGASSEMIQADRSKK